MKLTTALVLSVLAALPLYGQVNEDALFDSTETVVPITETPKLSDTGESTAFTGRVWSYTLIPIPKHTDVGDAPIYGINQANLFLDARLQKEAKAFVNFEVAQWNTNGTSSLNATIREAFIDFNLSRSVYVRTGKQVLQWGRSYFWNPTDLISEDRHSFLRMDRYRDGVVGTRLTVPVGMDQSITAFVNHQAATLKALSVALKYEFLIGNTEIGLSTWQRSQSVGVYGLDASTRWLGLDIKAESAWSYGSNTPKYTPSLQPVWITNEWVNRSTVTLTRSLDWELSERISITQELFYNSHGYTDAPFSTPGRIAALQAAGHYTPNMIGQWYTATFVTVAKFPVTDSTLSFNSISNLSDWSHTTGISATYAPINRMTLSTGLYVYWGSPDGEYTVNGASISPEFSLSVDF